MKKAIITSIAALTILAGTSVAAFASGDRYEHRYRDGDNLRKVSVCKFGGKNCRDEKGRYRNHERREYRYGHDNDHRRYHGKRSWRYDD